MQVIFFVIEAVLIFAIYLSNISFFPLYGLDEALFMNPSCTLAEKGFLGTPVAASFLGLDKYTFWQPPTYLLLQAAFMYIFECSLFVSRIFSLIAGLFTLLFVYYIAKNLFGKAPAEWAVMFLAIAPSFFMVSRLARMDVFVSLFLTASFYFYIRARQKQKSFLYVLAGFLAGLGATSHLNGLIIPIIYLLIFVFDYKMHRRAKTAYFFSGLSIPFLVWIAYLSKNIPVFLTQITFQKGVGFGALSISEQIANWLKLWNVLGYDLAYSLFLLAGFLYMFRERKHTSLKIMLVALLGYVHLVKPTIWYVSYAMPFLALSAAATLESVLAKSKTFFLEKYRRIIIIFCLLCFFVGTNFYALERHNSYDFESHKENIYDVIPRNSNATIVGTLQNWVFLKDSKYVATSYAVRNGSNYLENEEDVFTVMKQVRPRYLIFHNDDMNPLAQEIILASLGGRDGVELKELKRVDCTSCYNGGFVIYGVVWK